MKQSSIEWIIEKITDMLHESNHPELANLYEQAKAMHEHEVKDAYIAGNNVSETRNPEQYYKDKFA